MFVGVLCVLAFVLISVNGTCQSVDGQSVPWWILYQQKDRPYFHQYVDSTNSQRIKEHYPEKVDSVLSKVMSSVIDQQEAEYILYSSDLINVKDIAAKTSIPTYSKWMHGILGTVSSWESGFWILHNNLLFPAIKHGVLAEPGSKAWYATTVGDSSADLFYICLTADTQGNITEMLTSIMAGNPFIYKRKLRSYNFIQPYFKEVRPLQTSFGYEMSASIFLDCLYTSSSNISTNCLFTYAVTTGAGINIFTRPRGMIKHSSAFCYDDQSVSLFDFLKLEKGSTLKSGFSHTMFAFSDKTDSSANGITCFGQDVAANAEMVAVMICAKLPNVHMNVIKSAKLSQWPCRNRNSHQKRSNLYNQGKAKHSTHMVTNVKQTDLFPTRKGNNDDENNNVLISDATKDSDEKDAAKFCLMYDCDKNEDVQKEQEQFDISHSKNSLLKNPKTEDLFSKMVTDITMKHTIKNPRKIHKTDIKKKKVIKPKGSLEVSQFLLKNEKAVLGLFCQEGCRFCQNAKEQFIMLANSIQTEYLDFVIMDINEPSLPDDLQVPFTPYVRYKISGVSQWTVYTGTIYDMKNFMTFLHKVTIEKRFSTDEYVLSDAKKGKDSLLTKYEISERKRRDTRDILKESSTEFGSFKKANSRVKRRLHNSFINKHIFKFDGLLSEEIVKQEFNWVNNYLKKNNKEPRFTNTFLATTNFHATTKSFDLVTYEYKKANKYDEVIYENGEKDLKFYSFNIKRINAILIHVTGFNTKHFKCGYSKNMKISVDAFVDNDNDFQVYHLRTIPQHNHLEVKSCNMQKYENNKNKCYA